MSVYEIQLERACNNEGHLGSFGLSILGGYGTKFPAVVCELDPGGHADGSGKVNVGDKLTALNGDDLSKLTPKDLVNKIRTAPSPSTFTLAKDEVIRQQVIELLEKQERRAAVRREREKALLQGGDKKPHKKLTQTPSTSSMSVEERKKKIMSKIIEVEPSVNINDGRSGDIVQVYHNKIVGVVDASGSTEPDQHSEREVSPYRGGRHKSPRQTSPTSTCSTGSDAGWVPGNQIGVTRSTKQQRNDALQAGPHSSNNTHSIHTQEFGPNNLNTDHSMTAGLIDNSQQRQVSPVCVQVTPSPPHVSPTSAHPDKEGILQTVNGDGDDSGIVSTSGDYEVSVSTANPRDHGLGVALMIPSWNGSLTNTNRASLAEAVFIEELEKSQKAIPPNEAYREDDNIGSPKLTNVLDPEKREELMRKYRHTPTRTASKKKESPFAMAVSLARRLYMLDGFRKSEVAEKLADKSEFGQTVAKEYLRFFEFERMPLDESLRQFLSSFILVGESQERERIMVHFSDRYFECNPDSFLSSDTVHGLTIALLLLNTDLHNDHGRSKMSFSQFVINLEGIGVRLPKDSLKKYYNNIRKNPLEWALDEAEEEGDQIDETLTEEGVEPVRMYHVTIPGTFVEVELAENATLFKEGFVLRKNIMEGPHKKVSRGKRQWKPYYAYLKGFLLYFGEPQGELHLENTSSAIPICHCLAMGAHDYNKKNCVLRVTTSDWHSFLLQANNVTDMQQWIGAINKASAIYSTPPLSAPISSSNTFVRPTFPLAPTKNTLDQQVESLEARIKSLEKEIEEHQAYKPKGNKAKHSLLQVWFDKFEFLQYQMNCYRIFYASLTTNEIIDFNAPLPSGLVPSPSVSTLAVTGTNYDLDLRIRDSHTPPRSPSSSRKLSQGDLTSAGLTDSPLTKHRSGKKQ